MMKPAWVYYNADLLNKYKLKYIHTYTVFPCSVEISEYINFIIIFYL